MRYNEAMHELGNWELPLTQQLFQPHIALQNYLKPYQLLTGELNCSEKESWYILPDNSAHLIFYLVRKNGKLSPSLRLIGPRTKHRVINRVNRKLTFIATFKPAALWPFCKVPIHHLADKSTDATLLFDWLNEDILWQLSDLAQKSQILEFLALFERMLIEQLNENEISVSFWSAFSQLSVNPLSRVSDLAGELGITERHFRSLSRTFVGHSPKSIVQIERFTQSLLLTNHYRDWSAIACEAGYYDQSHMIAEYQKMTGKSPDRLFSL